MLSMIGEKSLRCSSLALSVNQTLFLFGNTNLHADDDGLISRIIPCDFIIYQIKFAFLTAFKLCEEKLTDTLPGHVVF